MRTLLAMIGLVLLTSGCQKNDGSSSQSSGPIQTQSATELLGDWITDCTNQNDVYTLSAWSLKEKGDAWITVYHFSSKNCSRQPIKIIGPLKAKYTVSAKDGDNYIVLFEREGFESETVKLKKTSDDKWVMVNKSGVPTNLNRAPKVESPVVPRDTAAADPSQFSIDTEGEWLGSCVATDASAREHGILRVKIEAGQITIGAESYVNSNCEGKTRKSTSRTSSYEVIEYSNQKAVLVIDKMKIKVMMVEGTLYFGGIALQKLPPT